jgi:hypothetical protein
MSFTVAALLIAAILGAGALLTGCGATRWPDLHRRLPRHRGAGVLLGFLCLVWAGVHICNILEGDMARFKLVVQVMVPAVTVLCFFFLDYLFSRSVAGILLLLVNHVLHEAFAVNVPMRPVFSTLCYLVGVAAIILVCYPWLMRDALEKSAQSATWRRNCTAGLGALACTLAGFALSN